MSNVLESIMAERHGDAEAAADDAALDDLRRRAGARVPRSLVDRLRAASGPAIIAEMKKASPSAGVLRTDYRPAEIAAAYERAGAVGLSVLTEPRHFLGGGEHLCQARQATSIPVLRKDFTSHPQQIVEAAALGADVVLLIVAALDAVRLGELYACAEELGLETIIESHTAAEIERALAQPRAIVGVNSRDLRTLTTDLAVARRLARELPADRLRIAESGIRTRDELLELRDLGYNGFLIGESLLRQDSPGAALAALLEG